MHLFPDPATDQHCLVGEDRVTLLCISCFTSALDGSLVFFQVDERGGKPGPIGNARKEQLGGLVQFVLETLLSYDEDICDIRHAEEILHVMKPVRLGVRIRKLRIDLGLP
jgi:hypothetical protein